MKEKPFNKEDVLSDLGRKDRSALQKYQDFFVGSPRISKLIGYELAHMIASPTPGALGYVLRQFLMLPLLREVGHGVQIGRNVSFRHPAKISIGNDSAIDDNCFLDARPIEAGQFTIGEGVIVARGSILASKSDEGYLHIGDNCTIGKNCVLVSTGGLRIGEWVGLADTCYLGGGRYRTDRHDVPMMKQQPYSNGPITIESDCWIGAGVYVLDGVTIGRGSIIGAGAVVREDVPPYTVVTPHQRLIMLPRTTDEREEVTEPTS